jgi:hypothetical protein
MKTRQARASAATGMLHSDGTAWQVQGAPAPNEIIWANAAVPAHQRFIGKLLSWGAFCTVIVFFLPIVLFLQQIVNLEGYAKPGNWAEWLIEQPLLKSALRCLCSCLPSCLCSCCFCSCCLCSCCRCSCLTSCCLACRCTSRCAPAAHPAHPGKPPVPRQLTPHRLVHACHTGPATVCAAAMQAIAPVASGTHGMHHGMHHVHAQGGGAADRVRGR